MEGDSVIGKLLNTIMPAIDWAIVSGAGIELIDRTVDENGFILKIDGQTVLVEFTLFPQANPPNRLSPEKLDAIAGAASNPGPRGRQA